MVLKWVVDGVLVRKNHMVNGLHIEVKKAMEKDQMISGGGRGGGRGGMAGGRG